LTAAPSLVVAHALDARERAVVADAPAGAADIVYLSALDRPARRAVGGRRRAGDQRA